jgi:hypothetical protein
MESRGCTGKEWGKTVLGWVWPKYWDWASRAPFLYHPTSEVRRQRLFGTSIPNYHQHHHMMSVMSLALSSFSRCEIGIISLACGIRSPKVGSRVLAGRGEYKKRHWESSKHPNMSEVISLSWSTGSTS